MMFSSPLREVVLSVALLTLNATVVNRADVSFQASNTHGGFADRLNIADLYIEGLDAPYNEELGRLGNLCAGRSHRERCLRINLRSTAVKAGAVHAGPSATSRVIGHLYAVMAFQPGYEIGYRLEFRPSEW